MKFSAQEEYGLRCLLQLARRGEGASLTIPEIARFENLSQTHVAKLLMVLRKEGLVVSTRGQAGGYSLARKPGEILVGEVLETLGGKLYDEEFCNKHSGQDELCTHAVDCSVRSLWQLIQKAVDGVVDKLTILDMLDEAPPKPNVTLFDSPKRRTSHTKMSKESQGSTAPFPISVTDRALGQVKRLVSKDGRPNVFLRIGVKGGGCSGMEYVMRLDDRELPNDLMESVEGIVIRCDAKSARYLEGSTFDYTGNLIGGGFKIENPNAVRSCGCGTSFTPA